MVGATGFRRCLCIVSAREMGDAPLLLEEVESEASCVSSRVFYRLLAPSIFPPGKDEVVGMIDRRE